MASSVITNRDRSPLSVEQLQRAVPSAFAQAPHDSRSNRYLYVPTSDMIDVMGREGWQPVWASQSRTRVADKQDFTKHMIRFAAPGSAPLAKVGDTRTELVLTNSHDGSSSVALSAGLFRLACLNGLIVGAGASDVFKVSHTRKWADEIIEGTYRVLNGQEQVADLVGEMTARELTQPERILLAEHAAALRWHGDTPPVTADRLLAVRRGADREATAWNTLNVLQENVIRGGLAYRGQRGGQTTFNHTRAVTGIDDTVRLNRGIWDSVATLTTGNRVDLAAEMFARLTAEERGQLAMRFTG